MIAHLKTCAALTGVVGITALGSVFPEAVLVLAMLLAAGASGRALYLYLNLRELPTTPLTILLNTRAMLSDEKRWMKGDYGDRNCACLAGALNLATGSPNAKQPYYVRVESWNRAVDLLNQAIPAGFKKSITGFNDGPETTHSDVLRVVDAAIALAENDEGGLAVLDAPIAGSAL